MAIIPTTKIVNGETKKHSLALRIIQVAWPIEVGLLIMFGLGLVVFAPDKINHYVMMLPYFTALIAGQGAAGFGGPRMKDRNETKRVTTEGTP